MGISINSKMSGFRKWSEGQQSKAIDEARTGENEGAVLATAEIGQGGKAPDQQPHSPWLVPEIGKL